MMRIWKGLTRQDMWHLEEAKVRSKVDFNTLREQQKAQGITCFVCERIELKLGAMKVVHHKYAYSHGVIEGEMITCGARGWPTSSDLQATDEAKVSCQRCLRILARKR